MSTLGIIGRIIPFPLICCCLATFSLTAQERAEEASDTVRTTLSIATAPTTLSGSAPVAPALRTYPTVLYPGENVITIEADAGIRSISLLADDAHQAGLYTVSPSEETEECLAAQTISIRVNTASQGVFPGFRVKLCDGTTDILPLRLSTVWTLDTVYFPDLVVGEQTMAGFSIRPGWMAGKQECIGLDSVTSTDPRVTFRYSFLPPLDICSTYRYLVRFDADRPGVYRFPVITWIRRDQPSGGFTTYPVADTGVVRVLPSETADVRIVEFDAEGNPATTVVDPDSTTLPLSPDATEVEIELQVEREEIE